jgi:putative endonuclease
MRWPWTRRLTRHELGALGERHAARALRAKGYVLLEANFRAPHGELDLIVRDGDTLVFVEVRTRSTDFQTPLSTIDAHKGRIVARTARYYRRVRRLPECYCRYDVVEVLATPFGDIRALNHFIGIEME